MRFLEHNSLAGPLTAALALACSSTSVGNPPRAGLEIEVVGYTEAGSAKRTAGPTVTRALLVIEKVKLVTRCSGGTEHEVTGPRVADLLGAGIVAGGPISIPDVPLDSFCKVVLKLHRLERDKAPAGSPPEIVDRSIYLEGQRTDGRRFRVEAEFDDEFELGARGGAFRLSAAQTHLFVAFAVSRWLDSAALDAIGGTGDLVIDKDRNKEAYEAFREAVKRSARLFEDQDDDDRLEPEEHDDDDTLASGEDDDREGSGGG